MKQLVTGVFAALVLCAGVADAAAQEATLTVIGYNLESGGSKIATLADRIDDHKADIWGFTEALEEWRKPLEEAAEKSTGTDFGSWYGTTGGKDRMILCWNKDVVSLEERPWELHWINKGGHRAPLVAHFWHKKAQVDFLVVVNHLARGNSGLRHKQASQLNKWARDYGDWPIIAMGDYNFDWEVEDGHHDRGYDNLITDEQFVWIRPKKLIRTQLSDGYDSVLDFIFASGPAAYWSAESEIIVSAGDEPDTNGTSDHRPLRAKFTLGQAKKDDTVAESIEESGAPANWDWRTKPNRRRGSDSGPNEPGPESTLRLRIGELEAEVETLKRQLRELMDKIK